MENGLMSFERQCEELVLKEATWLRTVEKNVHWKVSSYHTDAICDLSTVFGIGVNRQIFAQRLDEKLPGARINPYEIDTLVPTDENANLLAGTLQHFHSFRHTMLKRMEWVLMPDGRRQLIVGASFSFRRNERILIVHTAGISFRRIAEAQQIIYDSATGDRQPVVEGFLVALDRSPAVSPWERQFMALKHASAISIPINAYPADPMKCDLCMSGVPLEQVEQARWIESTG